MIRSTATVEAVAVESVIADAVKRADSVDARGELTAAAVLSQTLVHVCLTQHVKYIWLTCNFCNNNNHYLGHNETCVWRRAYNTGHQR